MPTTTTSTTTTTTTTQPPYASDSDLLNIRPNITSLGISNWSTIQIKARDIINRDLEAGWYRKACNKKGIDRLVTPFTPSLMLNSNTQLKDLGVYKTLELVYRYLTKDSIQDVYLEQSIYYSKEYNKELKTIIAIGIHYDWDANGSIGSDEQYYQRNIRRLVRC